MEQLWQLFGATAQLEAVGDVGYHILALLAGIQALVRGFRRGLTRQVCALLGLAFGVVCAHLFADEGQRLARLLFPGIESHYCSGFIYSLISAAGIYTCVFLCFRWLTRVLGRALEVIHTGIFNALLGSGFNFTKTLLMLSMAYNSVVCVNPSSKLMKYASASDGNVVEAVMRLAPALLGSMSLEDLEHLIKLHEARDISQNITPAPGVLNIGDDSDTPACMYAAAETSDLSPSNINLSSSI
ncbi:MAG: CvpA family protein [Muribaculaceae bacterium]|nr:CvpA family protein [Muribaculaceae bacterium]